MTIEELKRRKKELGYTNEDISRIAQIPLATVEKIFAGITKSPRYYTMQALEKALASKYIEIASSEGSFGRVAEEAIEYESIKQGEYTISDIEGLPEDQRVELIDGYLYIMEAPGYEHQEFSGWLYFELKSYLKMAGGKCRPLIAPLDVQLDKDDRTLVQPDVMVVCDEKKITKKRIYGAPEMIVEVLSELTKRKDLTIKTEKYRKAGVREYWIVDIENERIIVYDFESDDVMHIYGFEEKIPVAIWDGKLKIDMKEYQKERLQL